MGFYINPRDMSKDKWLRENATLGPVDRPYSEGEPLEGGHWVCLADNGPFKAAGIAYNTGELEAFLHPDPRPKTWWYVPDDRLVAVEPSVAPHLT